MRKKLLSMMLGLGAFLGVQAQEVTTLIDYPTSKEGTAITGTTEEGTVKIHLNKDAVPCYTLKNGYTADGAYNGNSINLTTDGGFKKGDVVTIAGAINNSEESKRATAVLFSLDAEGKKATVLHQFADFINSRLVADDPVEESFTLEEDVEKLYLGRDGGTGANLTLIKVTRAAGATPSTPAITFTAGAVERTITVGLGAAGKVSVDWGDGTLVEQEAAAAYDGWDNALEFTGTPAGEVKIYGEGIIYLQAFTKMVNGVVSGGITAIDLSNASTITELDIHQNSLTKVDLSALTALTSLTIGVNDLTELDLSANTELTTLDANATADIAGKLTSLDLSKNTKLINLKANYNKIATIDLSSNLSLKNIYLLNNGMTSINFGENTTDKIYISLNYNELEKLDVTALTGLVNGTLFLLNNNLTELKHSGVKTLNVTGNKFNLATLYEVAQNVTTLTSASMQDYEIAATIDKTIDLSSQAVINGEASTIAWKTETGTALEEGTDYTVENGVYTFIKEQTEKVYAELSNPTVLPKLTTPIKTTLAAVAAVVTGIDAVAADNAATVWYNVNGQRVENPAKGLYIVNGKKVVLK